MVTVACVLLSGGIYTPEWVAKLQRQVAKHLTIKHRFVCLSDIDVPCERIPITGRWPKYWSKLEMMQPKLLEPPILYFDLDTLILGNINELSKPDGFWMPKINHAFRSGCMFWNRQTYPIWIAFLADPTGNMKLYDKRRPFGDDSFYPDFVSVSAFPGEQVTYYTGSDNDLKSKVVTFPPGKKPNTANGWAQEMWEAA